MEDFLNIIEEYLQNNQSDINKVELTKEQAVRTYSVRYPDMTELLQEYKNDKMIVVFFIYNNEQFVIFTDEDYNYVTHRLVSDAVTVNNKEVYDE